MAGLEIVYAVHKFEAENPDEISLNIGEKVIILEKDEGYNDGWWHGRNEKGQVGLFPITYTSKLPPSVKLTTSASTPVDNKLDSVENSISKMKISSIKKSNSVTSSSSISSKNIQLLVRQSLNNPELNKAVEEWTSENVSTWILSVGFDRELADNFKDQEITGDILLELTLDSLKELQVNTFGKRFKIHNAINALKQESKLQKSQKLRPNSPPISNSQHLTATINNNKTQAYLDDDLVSDYSTIIRNSQILSTPNYKPSPSPVPPERPSIPLDMDLIATSPRLNTLVEQHQYESIQRPSSSLGSSYQDFRRNTTNQSKLIQEEDESRTSNGSSRYSFMRSSLLTSTNNNKPLSILPQSQLNHNLDDVSEMEGWLYKRGDKYKNWNKRWFVLKGNNLFYFKNPKAPRMKGIINLRGYRIEVDESIHAGKYCFMAQHEKERTFYFFTEHEKSMKDWLKALMKATIVRNYASPVMSSSTIATISLDQARKMRPRPPSIIFEQKEHSRSNTPLNFPSTSSNFSNMSSNLSSNLSSNFSNSIHQTSHVSLVSEPPQPILSYSQSQFQRSPSVQSHRPIPQSRHIVNDHLSDYSVEIRQPMKDSGFTSGSLTNRSIAEDSSYSSHQSGNKSIVQINLNDEDVIDPNQPDHILKTREEDYFDWINQFIQFPIKSLSDLSTGKILIEFLEKITGKQVTLPTQVAQSISAQNMDNIIAAYKFMSLEGIELDGACTIRDVANGNETKIMHLLDAIDYWYKSNISNSNGKKMASGGTFGEEDQYKLRELDQ